MTNSYSPEPDLTDPAIEPLRLQELAQTHPHLWDEILDHPNVYPGLTDWIRDRQAEQDAAHTTETDSLATDSASLDDQPTATEATAAEVDDDVDVDVDVDETVASETPEASDHEAQNSWFPQPSVVDQPVDEPAQTAAQPFSEQNYGWAQPSPTQPTQQFGATPPQDTGQHQAWTQPNYGFDQSRQGFTQPGMYASQRRTASTIDLSSRRTWGSFIAGGAAFLALFAFFFNPSAGPTPMPGVSHFASGGWVLLLLLIATVALSVIDLLMPSRWSRYFFVVLGVGTAFAVIARYMTVIGVLTFYGAGFSLVWLIFTALILLAGMMVYFAPETTQHTPRQPQSSPYQSTQNQSGGHQYDAFNQPNQPGAQPGYGQQPPQFGGYQPPQNPGSPQ